MNLQPLTSENYLHSYLNFGDRQAGISLVYCHEKEKFYYNAYCLESKLLKELFSVEYEFLEDALVTLNSEFGQWELKSHDKTENKGCDSCAAKKK